MGEAASWKIEGHGAHLRCGPLEAYAGCGPGGTVILPSKWHSTAITTIGILESDERMECSQLSEFADLYVRGADLVADFAPAGPDRIAPQIYWRASCEDRGVVVRIELVLSVRTELLDSDPTWSFASFVIESELFHASALEARRFQKIAAGKRTFGPDESRDHLFVFRQRALGLSYAEMIHPTDFVAAEVTSATPDGQPPLFLESKLFPEHLEKGVIRRGRICGWFLPAEGDLETAVRLAKRFVDEPLPLTA